jgi:bifunctional non-homologous end joining protein LigD
MSLRVYNQKRKFNETPEPRGKKASRAGQLRFVVQMHDASRLHFDLRLEFDGVFKSWAVPKGPSLNPLDQRLAVFVEDHPLEYGSFEGIIPPGNYGAGTVLIWDEGTYIERSSEGRKDSEAAMHKNFAKGHVTFVLNGKKLKGEFALIKLKKDESEKAWLLVKKRDQYSTYKTRDVLSNESVKSGRTIEQIASQAKAKGQVWLPKKGKQTKPSPVPKKRTPLPRKTKPMIATVGRSAPDQSWILEPQLNGLRAIAEVEGKRAKLYSKAGLSFNPKYPKIIEQLGSMNLTALFDGEIVDSIYFIYDLLYANDHDLRHEPLKTRQKHLKSAFKDTTHVKHVERFEAKGGQQVAKNPNSLYKSGTTAEWQLVETKSKKTQTTADNEPRLTHLDKIYFPDDGLTKGDLISYYESIADFILPYLIDRPESMNRMPNGIARPGFFQKDLTGHIPRWLKTERIFSESADKSIDYLLCQDKRSLLYMVNLGCIELNPWFSRVRHLERPDFLVIDLDPDGNPFDEVIETAHQIHAILDEVGAANYCKTSGATGIHIGVPLGAKYDYDTARAFAEKVCRIVEHSNPSRTSTHRNPARRRKKIYLDFMQNRRGQTLAAPFCVRPRPGAPVSMPVTWRELKKGLRPEQFSLINALSRLRKVEDAWKGILGPSINLTKCAKILQRKYDKA